MNKRLSKIIVLVITTLSIIPSALAKQATEEELASIPPIPAEFRGVWVATVSNVDWPSKPGLSTKEQQKELIAILDKCIELNLNAVLFQVRTSADALYKSDFEPWSFYITGKQGVAPDPYYDPLEFAVAEAHKRGIELHAWFNPYRSGLLHENKVFDKTHINMTNPELVKKYGNWVWMNPAEPAVIKRTIDVFMDVATRYDVDGIHIDDYFYPYKIKGKDFPDGKQYKAYKKAGGQMSKSDWRRDNVNKFIKTFYTKLKQEAPDVKFGISPFGIWKPGHPHMIKGMNQYEALYADAKLWLNEGWVDYFTPQIYWSIRNPNQSFTDLLAWWQSENTQGRHIWPGLFTTLTQNTDRSRYFDDKEIRYQVEWSRIIVPKSPGTVHFSMKWFMKNGGNISDTVKQTVYKNKALVPASPWLKTKAPKLPYASIVLSHDKARIAMSSNLKDCMNWIVQIKRGNNWTYNIFPASQTECEIDMKHSEEIELVVLTVQGKNGSLSPKNIIYRQ